MIFFFGFLFRRRERVVRFHFHCTAYYSLELGGGSRGGAVGLFTALQAGKSWVRLLMVQNFLLT